jgi:hypothetical protein
VFALKNDWKVSIHSFVLTKVKMASGEWIL